VNPFSLIGRRQRSAASTTHDARAVHPHALFVARSQDCARFKRGGGFAAQHARELNPLGASNTRSSLNQLCRHWLYRIPRTPGGTVRHLPYWPPDLGTGSPTPQGPGIGLPRAAFNPVLGSPSLRYRHAVCGRKRRRARKDLRTP